MADADVGLTLAVAMAIGVVAQGLAQRIKIPGIVLLLAVAAFGFVMVPTAESLGIEAATLAARLGIGALIGGAAGAILLLASGPLRLLPGGLENIFALSLVILAFYLSNEAIAESGITAALAAGVVVGNSKHHRKLDELLEFKEQLTVLLIAVLFVLLAADIRLADVAALGWPMVGVVALLMFAVRPINAFVATAGTRHGVRQRLFLSWLAPRGIVAAAVASLFANSLAAAGVDGGSALRAAVFVVIAATVTIQGATCGPLASLLGLRRPARAGFVIAGANRLGRELAAALEEAGEQVTLIDSNPQSIRAAQEAGLTAIHGNALRDSVLQRAKVGERLGVAALTTNDKTNYLIARLVAEDHGSHSSIALGGDERLDEAVLEDRDDSILFGGHRDLETWNALLRDGRAGRRSWLCDRSVAAGSIDDDGLPLIVIRERGDVELVDQRTEVKPGDRLVMLVAQAPPT